MAPQREWLEQDYYKELGVAQTATPEEIKRAYRKLARELHPDANPGDSAAEERFKRVSEAHSVLADTAKREEYDQVRKMMAGGRVPGGFGNFSGSSSNYGGGFSSDRFSGGATEFDLGDLLGGDAGGGRGGFGDFLGSMFEGRGSRDTGASRASSQRRRRGSDLETAITLSFRDAALGASVPLTITSPSSCTTCHGAGAKPGTSPRVCPRCNGSGFVSHNQGAFGFSEPCPDCGGTGTRIDDPCTDCGGTGVTVRQRNITVKVPPGVEDGQRIRLTGQGEAGQRGAPSGDLYVTVTVRPDKLFTRSGNDLKVTAPVRFSELVEGATISVPTLEGKVGLKIPPHTADGRTLRVKGRGVPKRTGGAGNLLVTLKVSVPDKLSAEATKALDDYAAAEKASGFDPRAGWGA